MALVSEYGGIKPSIITFEPYKQTIETITGLFLLYPIIEEEYLRDGIIYHFFKKSFWGKKQLGYLKMEYLPGKHTDTSLKEDSNGNPLPPYTDIVIGFEYGSEHKSVTTERFQLYNLQSPEKQVLSYGILLENIGVQNTVFRKLQAEEFNSAGDIMLLNTGRLDSLKKSIELLESVKSKLKVFDKYLSKSEYQPTPNE